VATAADVATAVIEAAIAIAAGGVNASGAAS
jgi:hypothetical protein